MVTSVIGKIFLQAYNAKYNKNHTPKEFFLEVYYPLFLGAEKYMMTAGNSPLENPKLSWDDMILGKKPFETIEQREERLRKFLEKVDSGVPDASVAVSYPTADAQATTSGQVSVCQEKIDPSEIYLSWIGAGLGVGVQGGMTILFDKAELLLDIFDGWSEYRKFLNTTPNMKGNQVNTWNGQWIYKKYNSAVTSAAMSNALSTKNNLITVDTLPWAELLVALSRHFTIPRMMGYVYNIGQTNTTIGFIPFSLSPIRKASELYIRFFGTESYENALKLFGTAFGFAMACREGVIGIKALEPKGLSKIMKEGKIPSYKPDKEEQKIQFRTYKIWLLAMLNNEELWNKAETFANTLQTFSMGGKAGKTERSNAVKQLLEATNKLSFMKQLSSMIGGVEDPDLFKEIAAVVNLMPSDNVPYFLTLIRLHYAVINNPSKNK